MKRLMLFGAVLCILALTACESKYKVVTADVRAQMLDELRSGKLSLDCTSSCMFTWIQQAPRMHALDISERWEDLAIGVMQIGYEQDLSYYYMGQAAQGLGYHTAAISYYQYAMALATGQNNLARCKSGQSNVSDPCQGVDIAGTVPALIAASRAALASAASAPPPAPSRRRQNTTSSPAVTPANKTVTPPSSGDTGNSGWVLPPVPTPTLN